MSFSGCVLLYTIKKLQFLLLSCPGAGQRMDKYIIFVGHHAVSDYVLYMCSPQYQPYWSNKYPHFWLDTYSYFLPHVPPSYTYNIKVISFWTTVFLSIYFFRYVAYAVFQKYHVLYSIGGGGRWIQAAFQKPFAGFSYIIYNTAIDVICTWSMRSVIQQIVELTRNPHCSLLLQ